MKRRRSSRPAARAARVLTLLATMAGALLVPAQAAMAAGTTYYVDCSASSNGSGTQASPWNAVSSVNSTTFTAGDSILFKAGTTCTGQLSPGGSGASGSNISISSYGSGAKPVIDAAGATGAVIKLLNQQYWDIGGLELIDNASSPAYRSGVLAENSSGGVLHHIRVHDMYIHNIAGYGGGWYSTNAGVGVQTDHTTPVSTWDDVVVENNTFDHVDRIAVAVTPDGDGQGTGLTTGTIIRGNTMTYDGADDILVVKNDGALIDGNKAGYGGAKNTCPPSGQYCNGASAGIWMSGSSNTVVQNNEVYCHRNGADGTGYDVDWGNHNTTFQYNYSHQNLGGFLLVMPPFSIANEPTSTVPSDGTVVRYNISENDGSNSGCPASGTPTHGSGVFHFVGNIPNKSGSSGTVPLFYNNSIYINKSGLNTPILYSRKGSTVTGTLSFRNNAVFNYGTGGYFTTSAGSVYSNNLFYGTHPSSEPADAAKVTADPEFRNPGNAASSSYTGTDAYQVHPSSPVIRAGTVISDNGGKDAFGNAVSATAAPNIGAYNGTGGNLVSNADFETGSMSPWVNSGAAPSVTSSNARTGTYALTTQASGSGANQNLTGLSPNTTYLLTGWAKVANAGETLAIGVKNYGGTETFTNVATSSYTQAAVLFTTGSSSTTATIYCWKNTGGAGAGYCDDIAVEALSSATNGVANPGFESGALSPWAQSTGMASSVVASNTRTGTYSLQTGASASGAIQTVSGLDSSGTYLLAGWAKVATAGEEVAVGVKSFGGTETYLRTSATSYAQQPIFFTTGATTTSAAAYCYKNSGSSAGYCDDYTLIKLP
ncbi:carbohydrate binding domain-containing protein [Streptomyces sp. ME18-1-4]|uniref:carbohydrate binding domain-containing protein n=1 Tax=Streptomyces sp. ME18-1-4 TaxID=3028685 RepID=UPI0029BC1A99|nr:carbohydrate binding domain-containing protein [Streptomyces sp. ME18-1-4]MDX3247126.1 carbohydrate binding domain-containing protein [Streptomyces sp. ME18-1-4]